MPLFSTVMTSNGYILLQWYVLCNITNPGLRQHHNMEFPYGNFTLRTPLFYKWSLFFLQGFPGMLRRSRRRYNFWGLCAVAIKRRDWCLGKWWYSEWNCNRILWSDGWTRWRRWANTMPTRVRNEREFSPLHSHLYQSLEILQVSLPYPLKLKVSFSLHIYTLIYTKNNDLWIQLCAHWCNGWCLKLRWWKASTVCVIFTGGHYSLHGQRLFCCQHIVEELLEYFLVKWGNTILFSAE